LVAGVSLAISFYGLGKKGLWGDEVWEAMWSRQQGFLETFLRFRTPPDHPLHFLLTQISTTFSDSEFFARLPSALLATGTVVTLFVLGKRVFGTWVGLLAALLLAAAPFHVWYAQEARPYGPLSFYSLLSLLYFWILLERVTVWRALGFALATCLNIYNHLFGLFPLLIEGILAGIWAAGLLFISANLEPGSMRVVARRIRNTLLVLGVSTLVAILLCFPLFDGILDFIAHKGPNWSDQIAPASFDLTPSFYVDLLSLFGAGPGWPFWIMFILFVLGVGAALRSRLWFGVVAVTWIALPPLVLWLAQPQHIFTPRYLLFLQPVYLLLVAYGLKVLADLVVTVGQRLLGFREHLQSRGLVVISVLFGAGLLALVFAPTVRGYGVEKINNWSAACSYLWKNTGPGDILVGNAYAYGILTWCIDIKRGGPYIPVVPADGIDLQDAVRQGRGVWYVNVTASAPEIDYVRNTFTEVPHSSWANTSLTPPVNSEVQLYPEGESNAAIYHYSPPEVPSGISFHDMKGSTISPEWPDYVEIPPGRSYSVRLKLESTAARQLRLKALKLEGRPIEVSVDGTYLGTVSSVSGGASWEEFVLPLPPGTGDIFTVQLANPGQETSAISSIKVELLSSVP
jgi:hypothetical protein